jgi:hypothetical protein
MIYFKIYGAKVGDMYAKTQQMMIFFEMGHNRIPQKNLTGKKNRNKIHLSKRYVYFCWH